MAFHAKNSRNNRIGHPIWRAEGVRHLDSGAVASVVVVEDEINVARNFVTGARRVAPWGGGVREGGFRVLLVGVFLRLSMENLRSGTSYNVTVDAAGVLGHWLAKSLGRSNPGWMGGLRYVWDRGLGQRASGFKGFGIGSGLSGGGDCNQSLWGFGAGIRGYGQVRLGK
ncbi:hypothetical protein Tco_0878405 [Tanacetum coccineum]|uniref:Uncharacterized protein n=1 Tax=Tanacetum coccineum TaxID=301880 RepID=A0ABQ5BZM7_9ASTR